MSRHDDRLVPSIAPLANSECSRAVEVLALAFRDNPLNRAVTRAEDPARRLRSNHHGMRSLLPVALRYGQVLVATLDGVVVGGLISSPPHCFPFPPPPLLPRLRTLLRQGWQTASRWGEVFELLETLHPKEPHWYLGTLGVDPSFQNRGVGAALLSSWIAGVDRDGATAYLETDTARNISFYERAGFTLDGETSILGVPVWCMRRLCPASPPQ